MGQKRGGGGGGGGQVVLTPCWEEEGHRVANWFELLVTETAGSSLQSVSSRERRQNPTPFNRLKNLRHLTSGKDGGVRGCNLSLTAKQRS